MKKFPAVGKKIPIEIYREIHRSLPVVCVDIIITDGKRFLLAKRSNEPEKNKWWMPGGRILKNELLKEAAARFLKKETGLRGKQYELLGFHEFFASPGYFPGINAHTIAFVFRVKAAGGSRIRLDGQHSEARWFSRVDKSWHPYVKRFLKKAGF